MSTACKRTLGLVRHLSMSQEEFAAFYSANKDRCLRAARAYGMGKETAEDAVAEAFSRAWARWDRVRELQAPAAWVVRTAVNADISWWRRLRREVKPRDDSHMREAPLTRGSDDPESITDLVAALRVLPPRQRDVVILRYLLDLDTAATAQWLDVAPGTVRASLHRALKTLRQHLVSTEEENVS